MGRSALDGDERRDYFRKTTIWVEASIAALKVSKVQAQGMGHRRYSIDISFPAQPQDRGPWCLSPGFYSLVLY